MGRESALISANIGDYSRTSPRPASASMTSSATLHKITLAVANKTNDLLYGRQPAGLLLGMDFLLVNEDVQGARPAQADPSWNLRFSFDVLFQAHGLCLDVVSKETIAGDAAVRNPRKRPTPWPE